MSHDKRAGFKHLTPVHEAHRILLRYVSVKVGEEKVSVNAALGRILAEGVVSAVDMPPFDRAAMDGFAVRAEDTYGASSSAPITLRSVGDLLIGDVPSVKVGRNETVSVVTGARLPDSANAVVMVEFTKQLAGGMIEISTETRPGENVSHVGEDVSKGTLILQRGTRILPQDVGMLCGLGIREITVMRKPRVAVVSTGNELSEDPVPIGKIADSNRPMLMAAARNLGCDTIDLGIVSDDYEAIRAKLIAGLESADIVLVTAGTSVGPGDVVPKVIDSLGPPGILVHGVAMRPSMPTGLGVANGKAIVSLPGYPVSAYIAFIEFVTPLIAHLLRTKVLPSPIVKARLIRRVAGVLGSRTYIRVKVSGDKAGLNVEPIRTSGAGILSSLVQANGFIIVPENVEGYEEGELVDIELFRPWETSGVE